MSRFSISLILVWNDVPAGRLSPDGRLALDNMWALQLKSGDMTADPGRGFSSITRHGKATHSAFMRTAPAAVGHRLRPRKLSVGTGDSGQASGCCVHGW